MTDARMRMEVEDGSERDNCNTPHPREAKPTFVVGLPLKGEGFLQRSHRHLALIPSPFRGRVRVGGAK